jgi:hypothetical protein
MNAVLFPQLELPGAPGPDFRTWDFFPHPIQSRPGVGLNVPLDCLAQFEPGFGEIVHLLEVEPELWAVAGGSEPGRWPWS